MELEIIDLKKEKGTLELEIFSKSGTINSIGEKLDGLSESISGENGKGQRHDIMASGLNDVSKLVGKSYDFSKGTDSNGKSSQLDQAELDMETIRKKTEEVLKNFDEKSDVVEGN